MPLDESVVSSVVNTNFKTVAEQPSLQANHAAHLANIGLANAVALQQQMGQLGAAATAKAIELLLTTDVAESAGLTPVAQIAGKVAQSTPPETAKPS